MKLSEAITYDLNGNLTNDYYKGLQNGYNVLNRVDNTIVTTGTSQYINYIYDAGGNLIRKQEYNNNVLGTTTDYIGGFVYLTQGTGTAALSYFARPEGRVLVNGSAFTQQFIITDGQGNARISFQNNGSSVAVVKQENSYYGFGLQLLNSPVSLPPKPNKQLYNGGSEWQNDYANGDTNLPDYYQTFNRNYDAAIGRFVQTDPYPESAESMTGYQYAGNMPIMMNDPDGDKVVPGNTYNYNYVSPLMPQNGPLNGITQQQFSDAFFAATGAAGDIENAGGSLPGGQNIFNTIFSELTGIISNNNYNASIHNSVASQEYAEMNGTGPAGYLSVYYQTSSQSTYAGQRPQSINIVNELDQANIESHMLLVPIDDQGGTYPVGLQQFLAIAVGESGGVFNATETKGIASSMINRINQAGTSLYDPGWLKKISYGGNTKTNFVAINGNNVDYNAVMGMTMSQIMNSSNPVIQAAISAYNNWGTDYSNPNGFADTGSYFWNSTGGLKYSTYNSTGYVITLTAGGTTFYRPN